MPCVHSSVHIPKCCTYLACVTRDDSGGKAPCYPDLQEDNRLVSRKLTHFPKVTRVGLELTAHDSKTSSLSSSQILVWIFPSKIKIVGHAMPLLPSPQPPSPHLLSGNCAFQKPGREKRDLGRPAFHGCFQLPPPTCKQDQVPRGWQGGWEGWDCLASPCGH